MCAPNNMIGGFYTPLTDVLAGIVASTTVCCGDLLGRVHRFGGIPPYLHLALVEIIGGTQGGQYVGVDLYQFFLDLESARAVQLFPSLPVFSPYRHKNRACMCMPYWPKHYAIILMALDHKQR
ncbi:hypothetical protein [Paenibacillus alvei]|uniref:hypothetical protein n=1 Tax=Paenibacillus alvei TaxID=44250 RepID=UPI0019D6AB8E|nr:hypothetical protein [Paenibacillus alvei]MBG9736956.1 hypothetical protein [Paenibacillus alvei]MBG9746478.1 hypothetical protein [Paenibacillus alvei]